MKTTIGYICVENRYRKISILWKTQLTKTNKPGVSRVHLNWSPNGPTCAFWSLKWIWHPEVGPFVWFTANSPVVSILRYQLNFIDLSKLIIYSIPYSIAGFSKPVQNRIKCLHPQFFFSLFSARLLQGNFYFRVGEAAIWRHLNVAIATEKRRTKP